MLRIIVGKPEKLITTLNARERLDVKTLTVDELMALASTDSLFGGERSFVVDGLLADPESGADVLDVAEAFVASPHEFIFEEEKLLKKPTDKLTKAGAKIEVFDGGKKAEAINVFALADAMAARDRKRLWLLMTKALQGGVAPENIAGILAWKARDMAAKRQGNLAETRALSRRLVTMYHDSHRGAGELSLMLEHFALTL